MPHRSRRALRPKRPAAPCDPKLRCRVHMTPQHVTHADFAPQPWSVSWHPRPAAETSGQELRHAEPEMTRLPHRRFLMAALAVFAVVLLGACGKQPEPAKAQKAESPTAQAAPAKVYVVGTDAAYAPFESQNEKGEIVGFDIDVVQGRGSQGRHRGQVRQHAVGRHLQRARPGRPRHGRLGGDDHRRAQADDGLQHALLRRGAADRRARPTARSRSSTT